MDTKERVKAIEQVLDDLDKGMKQLTSIEVKNFRIYYDLHGEMHPSLESAITKAINAFRNAYDVLLEAQRQVFEIYRLEHNDLSLEEAMFLILKG